MVLAHRRLRGKTKLAKIGKTAERNVRACLIINPRSGRGGIDLSDVLPVFWTNGWDIVVRQKLHGGHATTLAREAAQEGFDVVIDCGGDGTLSEIVDGVVGTDIAIGTLPGGTANVWAHELGISQRLRVASMQLVTSQRRRVDVGYVTVNGKHGQHFLLMAGLGADAAVMSRVSKPLKNRIGPAAIGLAAIEALPDMNAVPIRAEIGKLRWQGSVTQVVVGNSRRYATFTEMTPDAFIDDGQLDICLITASGVMRTTQQLASLLMRQRPGTATAETYRANAVTIYSQSLLPLQADGGTIDLSDDDITADGVVYAFSIVAQGVSMLVPRSYDGQLFKPASVWSGAERPVLRPASSNGVAKSKDSIKGAPDKGTRRALKITAIGVDGFSAVRLKNGRTLSITVQPDTTLRDGSGATSQLRDGLSTLAEGDLVRVKGKKNRDDGTIVARRVTVIPAIAAP